MSGEERHVVDYQAADGAEPECVEDCPACEQHPPLLPLPTRPAGLDALLDYVQARLEGADDQQARRAARQEGR